MRHLIVLAAIGLYVVVTPGCKTLEKTTVNVNLNVNLTVPPLGEHK